MNTLRKIFSIPELRNSILYVLGMLVLFRLLASIPVPGINTDNLRLFLEGNQFLGLLNIFSGGTLQNFSILMLGVGPYITSSIIFQLLTMVVPRLEELSKDGEFGQKKINQYTRYLSVPLALIQAYSLVVLLRSSSLHILPLDMTWFDTLTIMVVATAGTTFLMWIGELITEKKVGNGISLLIFAGIVASLPTSIGNLIGAYDPSQLPLLIAIVVLVLITIVGVVFITEGQRNIPVSYARQVQGTRVGSGMTTSLPLRVNMAGVIPIIFAISMVTFPPLIAQFFVRAQTDWIASSANWVVSMFQNQTFYGIIYFILVFAFTFFYTSVVVHPDRMAENLQKQGAFVPGIRPGSQTATYLTNVIMRITLAGALFLSIIAVLPLVVQGFLGTNALSIGGTSILIVVSVAIETWKQIDGQLSMRSYDGV
ncbi:MAG: preprotein translocase subunit SecY [Patescibacteria group bacterium]